MRCRVFSTALLAGMLALSVDAAAETIYRWVDAEGIVHFAYRPPEGVKAETVGIGPAAPVSTAPVSPDAPAAGGAADSDDTPPREPEPSYAQQRRDERAEKRQQKAAEQKKIGAQCEAMRHQLAATEPNPRVIVPTPGGGSRRLDDEERLELVNEAKAFIKKNCS